jgi:hypothetical protein
LGPKACARSDECLGELVAEASVPLEAIDDINASVLLSGREGAFQAMTAGLAAGEYQVVQVAGGWEPGWSVHHTLLHGVPVGLRMR